MMGGRVLGNPAAVPGRLQRRTSARASTQQAAPTPPLIPSSSRRQERQVRTQAVAAPPPASAQVPSPQPSQNGKATFASFEDMLTSSPDPVLVDWYSTWCGPCKLMHQVLVDVSASFKKLKVVKIDIDRYPELATRHRIQALPTLVLYRNGQPIDRIEGLLDAARLRQRIRFYLGGLEAKFGRR